MICMPIKAETLLGVMSANDSNGSLGKKLDEYRVTAKEVKELLKSTPIDTIALQLIAIKHMCLDDIKATERKKKGIKKNVEKAVKALTGMYDVDNHVHTCFKYVIPCKEDNKRMGYSDMHMIVIDEKSAFDDVDKEYMLPSEGYTYPSITKVLPHKNLTHKGVIDKAEIAMWKQKLRTEKNVDKWGRWYVPVKFDNGVVRIFHSEYLKIAMIHLGTDCLTLYTGKTKEGEGIGYIKEGKCEMVICPIHVKYNADKYPFWRNYVNENSNEREA